jgi:hypothetical protein
MTDQPTAGQPTAGQPTAGQPTAGQPTAGQPGEQAPVQHAFVDSLPDLIDATEYAAHPAGRLVRLRVTVTESGVELLGDALRPELAEAALTALAGGTMEQMLCG